MLPAGCGASRRLDKRSQGEWTVQGAWQGRDPRAGPAMRGSVQGPRLARQHAAASPTGDAAGKLGALRDVLPGAGFSGVGGFQGQGFKAGAAWVPACLRMNAPPRRCSRSLPTGLCAFPLAPGPLSPLAPTPPARRLERLQAPCGRLSLLAALERHQALAGRQPGWGRGEHRGVRWRAETRGPEPSGPACMPARPLFPSEAVAWEATACTCMHDSRSETTSGPGPSPRPL